MTNLIIGLGGTGSRVINNMALRFMNEQRNPEQEGVYFAVMDTNIGDIGKLKAIHDMNITCIQTSAKRHGDKTEARIKFLGPDSTSLWLPMGVSLRENSLANGAGQRRYTSRLAFLCEETEIERDLEKLIAKAAKGINSDFNICVVSSLSGGTGAGSFIQTALLIQKILSRLDKTSSLLKGVFLLSDIWVKTCGMGTAEAEKVRANAYASLKELQGLAVFRRNSVETKYPFTLDDLYDLSNPEAEGRGIYDIAYLIDFETEAGRSFQTLSEYEQYAAEFVYVNALSPMADAIRGPEDNWKFCGDIHKGAFLSKSGIGTAEYPVNDIIDYCAMCSVKESISTGWRKIDEQMEVRKKDYEEKRRDFDAREEYVKIFDSDPYYSEKFKDAINISKPGGKRANDPPEYTGATVAKFMSDLEGIIVTMIMGETEATEEGRGIQLSNEVREIIDNRPYYCGVYAYSDMYYPEGDKKQKEFRKLEQADENSCYSNEGTCKNLFVADRERIKEAKKEIEKNYEAVADAVLEICCPIDMGSKGFGAASDVFSSRASTGYSVLDLLTERYAKKERTGQNKRNEVYANSTLFIHPVAARYVLNKLLVLLKNKQSETASLFSEALINAQDVFSGEEESEASDYKKIGGNRFKETSWEEFLERKKKSWYASKKSILNAFKEEYKKYRDNCISYLQAYAEALVAKQVYEKMVDRVAALLEKIELFFEKLPAISTSYDKAIRKNISINSNDGVQYYVCASAEDKEKAFRKINVAAMENESIYGIIIESIYGSMCADKLNIEANRKYRTQDIDMIFKNGAHDYYVSQLKANADASFKLNIDIFEAAYRESDFKAEREGTDLSRENPELQVERHKRALQDLLRIVKDRAMPFLKTDVKYQYDETVVKLDAWGMNKEHAEDYKDDLKELGGVDVDALTDGARYTPYEMVYYTGEGGYAAYDLRKCKRSVDNLNAAGVYYTAYQNVINRMTDEVSGSTTSAQREMALLRTPHLDKRWHEWLPAIEDFDDADEEKIKQRKEKFYRHICLALAYGVLKSDGKYFRLSYKVDPIKNNGIEVRHREIAILFDVLRVNQEFAQKAGELESRFEIECKKRNDSARDTHFINGTPEKNGVVGGLCAYNSSNIMLMLGRYYKDAGKSDAEGRIFAAAIEKIIMDYVSKYTPLKDKSDAEIAKCRKEAHERLLQARNYAVQWIRSGNKGEGGELTGSASYIDCGSGMDSWIFEWKQDWNLDDTLDASDGTAKADDPSDKSDGGVKTDGQS